MTDFEIKREGFFDVLHEVKPMFDLNFNETGQNPDRLSLSIDYQKYAEYDALGALFFFVCRVDGKAIGYCMFLTLKGAHHKDLIVALNDVIFVLPEFRKNGIGTQLINFAETYMKGVGAHKITWEIRTQRDWSPILKKKGYIQEAVTYGKLLE